MLLMEQANVPLRTHILAATLYRVCQHLNQERFPHFPHGEGIQLSPRKLPSTMNSDLQTAEIS